MSDQDRGAGQPVLYIIVCAAPPAMDVQVLIDLAQQDGWEVCLIATPRAFQWLDVPGLTERTGHPVRHDYKLPGEPDVLPEPDAIIVARRPSTPSTSGRRGSPTPWRLGCCVSDRQGPGGGSTSLPECRPRRASRARRGIERLRRLGVRVLFGPDVLPLHRPRQGERDQFPWHLTLPALKEALHTRGGNDPTP